eukprot:9601811-Prorocentrum_lima.AAC.1
MKILTYNGTEPSKESQTSSTAHRLIVARESQRRGKTGSVRRRGIQPRQYRTYGIKVEDGEKKRGRIPSEN